MEQRDATARFAVCIKNDDYVDDLKVGTVYRVLRDESTETSSCLRIVDETGEDYLYPAHYFAMVEVSSQLDIPD